MLYNVGCVFNKLKIMMIFEPVYPISGVCSKYIKLCTKADGRETNDRGN